MTDIKGMYSPGYILLFCQHLSSVANHNREQAAKLVADVNYHKREKEQVLDARNIAHEESMFKFRAQTSAIVDKLKTTIKERNQLVCGTREMAEDVAIEYCSLRQSARAKEVELANVANVRLSNLKQSKEREWKVQSWCKIGSPKTSRVG